MSRVKAPTGGQDKGKGPETELSGPRTQVPTMLAASPGSSPITASNIKALVENINQKIDGMATRLSTIEQHVSVALQNMPQLPVREHPQQESIPVRDHPCSGTSMRQWLSAGQPRPYTSGVRSRSSSVSQMTGSNEEDLYDYRDPRGPEVSCLEDDDCNWAMELQAHCAHITRYEKAAHDAWQRQYETYSSLLELAERRRASASAIAGRTNQYVKAGCI